MLWLGDRQGAQLDHLDRRVVGAVATSLVNAPRNRAAIDRSVAMGLGLGYEIESWRNQLPLEHRLRGISWKDTGLDVDGKVYRPDAAPLSSAAARRRARVIVAAQATPRNRVAPGSIVVSGGHFLEHDQLGTGRENELLLARACAQEFRQRGLGEPGADSHQSRRLLFVTVLVNAERLDEPTVAELVRAYAEIRVDGFFLWAANFNESLRQARLLLELAQGLQSAATRPVVAGGLWHWHVAALERGLAATCVGPHRLKLNLWPDEPEDVPDGEERPGRATFVYHGPILGCLPVDQSATLKRAAAFARRPCPCGMHPASQPPITHDEKIAHNAWWLMRESAAGLALEDLPRLSLRVPAAREERNALHVGRLAACWSTTREDEMQDSDERSQ